ncbi:xanthine dehydrogenase small subunit [Rubellimicrobium sp. CFH 75288]|uniref:xanthine dehydrogenase small subunit n=1 Tax=Rubellimicrobium sp. CFH 75288 TaxID=2697034 RepID=UPI001412C3D3|nr:xanthine dehydrogenase small subunit [Rubellimicrobium sp. CFH 75288]NAZ37064.1 xanthine dehydrogenase small subunit [Rubellimicrobium sp. CFH 75288]
MRIGFLLNGERVEADAPPTRTLLDWLREERGLTGTKEGCNEGDCGACTVLVTDERGARALNACILFLPQLRGKAVRTVEGIAGPEGALHPVQRAMVDHHGSQCGFCTPGFVVAMAAAHLNGDCDHDAALAGNLCRCTGYAPILRAAEAAAAEPVPDWMRDRPNPDDAPPAGSGGAFLPRSADELAAWYADHPDATLIAGATDVGLWVTKGLRDLPEVAFLSGARDLARIEERDGRLWFGAGATMTEVLEAVRDRFPSWAALIGRYGSAQVRNAATIGGNVANGSPIGDNPPVLLALGARLHLRRGEERRVLPVEDFFLDYGRQDRRPGEFLEGIDVPLSAPGLRVWKVSKRWDQDISAVCGAFDIRVEDGRVVRVRTGFGGMAATPRRARALEAALEGRPWDEATVEAAVPALAEDFRPIDDMRASAAYRLEVAGNLLRRYLHESRGAAVSVRAVRP